MPLRSRRERIMNDVPVLIPLTSLQPHPRNPRLVMREEVVASIEQQIRSTGFDASHSVITRAVNGHYETISGHHRIEAAKRAGLKEIPGWVRVMDDETAFM